MSHRILIVDDNHDLTESLSELLELEGYSTDIAYNVADALRMLDTNDYSYCISDIKLPDGNGIEVFNYARTILPYSHIITITGFRLEQTISDVFDCTGQPVINLDNNVKALTSMLSGKDSDDVKLVVTNNDNHILTPGQAEQLNLTDYHYIASLPEDISFAAIPDSSLYIIDMHCPVIQSIGLAYELKKINPGAKILIVMPPIDLHGNPLQSFKDTGMLFKPFQTDFFLSIIDNALASAASK